MKVPIKVIYAEDKEVFRKSVLRQLRAFHIRAVCQAANGRELLQNLDKEHDVILLDLEMPVMDGNAAMDHIVEHRPDLKVIIISQHDEDLLIENYITRGAKGYICKDAFSGDIEILVKMIRTVASGGTYIHKAADHGMSPKYTGTQKEIIPMIVQGMTNSEIADEKGVQERAIEKLRNKIYAKIGGSKAIDFYRYAFSKGLHFLKTIRRK